MTFTHEQIDKIRTFLVHVYLNPVPTRIDLEVTPSWYDYEVEKDVVSFGYIQTRKATINGKRYLEIWRNNSRRVKREALPFLAHLKGLSDQDLNNLNDDGWASIFESLPEDIVLQIIPIINTGRRLYMWKWEDKILGYSEDSLEAMFNMVKAFRDISENLEMV